MVNKVTVKVKDRVRIKVRIRLRVGIGSECNWGIKTVAISSLARPLYGKLFPCYIKASQCNILISRETVG